ncbi:hypothetical protein [Amycolatopsis sp. PS_44_ISF1]|uniref:hypothetical protein n=1 Tax=Amycolatopsis sp. PS_44_ISF1 TaxID=2974917 RepID=UPI0028DED800|nr:hypothetical protein [Amycolatopsis sp. PS_44_ISF1]MDT8916120.1 hypothetical protein [Amycolatopsis sp. PS_44_ISF1]
MSSPPVAAPGRGPARALARWLLLGAVLLGVVAMHHVPAPGCGMTGASASLTPAAGMAPPARAAGTAAPDPRGDTAAPDPRGDTAAPAGMDGASHSMLHLCLAVLLIAAALLLRAARTRRSRPATATAGPGKTGEARPPPGRGGRELLAVSCVLRI